VDRHELRPGAVDFTRSPRSGAGFSYPWAVPVGDVCGMRPVTQRSRRCRLWFDCRPDRPLRRETVEIESLKANDSVSFIRSVHNKTYTRPASTWDRMADSLWYPSVESVVAIHDDIVSEYPETPSGVKDRGDIEFALNYIEEGSFGSTPETIHEKSYHLLRLLVANHPFVDANKRTALNTTVVFYSLNGYRFAYDDEIRTVLKQFGTDEAAVDTEEAIEYLRSHTEELDLAGEIERWRDDLVQYGIEQLTDDSSDPND